MLRSPHDRAIFALALPALASLAADPLVSLIDTAFIVQLGGSELAALGVATGLFGLAFFVFNFLAYGTTPLVAAALQDRSAVGPVVGQALTLAVVLGVVGMVGLELFAEQLVSAMGARGETHTMAVQYVRARAWATPAVLIITAANGAYRGVQDTRTPLWIALALNAVNLVLDPLLLFGLGWGLAGAAIASAVAQWLGAGLFLLAIFRWHHDRFRVPRRIPHPRELLPLLRVGSILSIRTLALVGTITVATAVASRISEAAIGAHQVGWQLWMVAAFIVDSLAVAGQAMVGKLVGQGRLSEAREVGDRLLFLGLVVGLALSAALGAFTALLPVVLSKTPQAAAELGAIWWLIVIMQPINAAIFVWDGVYMGAKRFSFTAISMVLAAVVGCGLLALVLPMQWGLLGVWSALVAVNAVRAMALAAGYVGWGREPAAS